MVKKVKNKDSLGFSFLKATGIIGAIIVGIMLVGGVAGVIARQLNNGGGVEHIDSAASMKGTFIEGCMKKVDDSMGCGCYWDNFYSDKATFSHIMNRSTEMSQEEIESIMAPYTTGCF